MNNTEQQQLISELTSLKDMLKATGVSNYYEALYAFVLLRRIDCILETVRGDIKDFYSNNKDVLPQDELEKGLFRITGYSFYNISGSGLLEVVDKQENTAINLQWYINGFNNDVKNILGMLHFQDVVSLLNRSHQLPLVIDTLIKINIGNDVIANEDVWGLYSLINNTINLESVPFSPFTTPEAVSNLMAHLIFSLDKSVIKGDNVFKTLYDPTCGTGGLEFIAKKYYTKELSGNKNTLSLCGQDLNSMACAVAKSIAILSGQNDGHFQIGDSLFADKFEGKKFDYIVSNFPWGMPWRNDAKDLYDNPKFHIGIPSRADATMLFIQDIISKMTPNGKASFITNVNALTSGDFGSGENSVRTYLFDNDMVECIVALPSSLFPYTNIETYLWVLTNNKEKNRKGKTQLIDARKIYHQSQSNKRLNAFSDDDIKQIESLYVHFRDSDNSRILDNSEFGELCLTIEQPERVGKSTFASDRCGKLVYNEGKLVADKRREFTEVVPLNEDADNYFEKKILPNIDEEAWIDYSQTRIGYKVNFKKIFFDKRTYSLRDAQNKFRSAEKKVVELNDRLSKENVFKKLSEVKAETFETKLKYICHFLSGRSIGPSEYVEDGYAYYLQPKDIIDGEINYDTCNQISEETFKSKRLSAYALKDGDLLVSVTGTIGKTIFFNEVEMPVIMGGGFVRIRSNGEFGYSQLYIKEILSSNILKDYSSVVSNSLTIPRLTLKELSNLTFRLPKDEEQQNEIAEILDNHDMLIKQLNKALKEEQGALKEYREALFMKVLDNKKD